MFNNEIEENIPKHILTHIQEEESNCQGSSSLNNIKSNQSKNLTILNKNKNLNIPKLSFGLDLKYWGQKIEPAERLKNNFNDNDFWSASNNEYNFKIKFIFKLIKKNIYFF